MPRKRLGNSVCITGFSRVGVLVLVSEVVHQVFPLYQCYSGKIRVSLRKRERE